MTIRIVKRERLDRGIRRIAREQMNAVIAELEDPSLPPETKIHHYRKCCKRLRALLRLTRGTMDDAYKDEDRRFRDAARLLGDLRDLHVQAGTRAAFGDDIQVAHSRGAVKAQLKGALTRMRAAHSAVDDWPVEARDFADLAPGFEHTYAKCRDAWRRAQKRPSDHRFHRFRRWAKYHRYQVNMLELANRAELRQRGRRLEQLGDNLGDAHDLAVLEANLAQDSDASAELLSRINRRKQALYAEALTLGRKCLIRRPETVTTELARWWACWRG